MTPQITKRQLPPGTPLAGLCRSLVAQEETALQATLADLRHVRQMLASTEPQALARALQSALQGASMVGKLQEKRHEFRQAAARILHVAPASVTLSLVAEHLPAPEAEPIWHGKRRLQQLAQDVSHINHGNAIVAWWCLNFVQQVFAGLMGQSAGSRYGAAGKAQPAVCGPTWQGQG
ncbi:MAG TPA: flagellar export chaperone FlgN [Gemmataceae bacterium]|nr:flagellar export chaperone FlgN [Gemmataceae bacterium]